MMGILRPAGSWLCVVLAFGLLMGMLWAVVGCDDGIVDPEPPPNIAINADLVDSLNVPEFWVLGSEDFRSISIGLGLSDAEKEAVRSGYLQPALVMIDIRDQDGNPTLNWIEMRDDGGEVEDLSPSEYEFSFSGDLVANDFTFNAMINANFAETEGQYTFEIIIDGLYDPNGPDRPDVLPDPILFVEITVSANEPPVFGEVSIPDSLHAGFDAQQWTIEVSDPNEPSGDEVVDVRISLIADDITWREFLFAPLNPPTWTFTTDSTFSAGLPTNDYMMTILATDQYEQPSDMIVGSLWIENLAPELLSLSAPDTAQQPSPGSLDNVYEFFLDVTDSQGQTDIARVYYTVVDPTGNFFEDDLFVFRDDGLDLDPVAGDGQWSHGFIVEETVSNFGTYTFTFYAEDRAGNTPPSLEHLLELIPSSEPQP